MRYDYLLTLFTGHDDDLRPQLMHPFPQGDYIIATDASALVIIDKAVCKRQYVATDKTPNALKLFQEIPQVCNEIISIEKLFESESYFNVKYEYKDCPECEGTGIITCKECGHDHECEDCDGKGELEIGENQLRTKISAHEKTIMIGQAVFKPHLVDKLLNAMLILGVESCIMLNNSKVQGNVFKINKHCHVLLMPLFQEEGGNQ